MSRFIVEHHIQDKEAWGKFIGEIMAPMKGKTVAEAQADPSFQGNKLLLSPASVSGDEQICLWELPAGATKEDCEAFIEEYTGGGSFVKNVVYPIEGSLGLDNLSFDAFVKDSINLVTNGSFQGFANDGELFVVHHNIVDKSGWDAMFGGKLGLAKGLSTSTELSKAWEVPDGYQGVTWSGLGDKDAVCMWSLPTGSTEEEFQAMIDKLCEGNAENDVYKVSSCIGGRLVHPDFYTQDVIAMVSA